MRAFLRIRQRSMTSFVTTRSWVSSNSCCSNQQGFVVHRIVNFRHVSSYTQTRNDNTDTDNNIGIGIGIDRSSIKQNNIQILHEGSTLSLGSSHSKQPIIVAAAWLWIHDPQFIHSTSGQKLRTFGQYSSRDHRIVQATCLSAHQVDIAAIEHLLPPPLGSYHPKGGIYEEIPTPPTQSLSSSSNERILFQLTWADGTKSFYDWNWLERYTQTFMPSNHSSTFTRVTKEIAIGAPTNSQAIPIPTLDYNHILHTNNGLWDALHGIFENGALLIKNSPINMDLNGMENDLAVVSMGQRLSGGRLSHGSLYGDTFRVESQPNAQNIAYTTVALPPHQDLTYYESKPFLQLLQCVSNAGKGGASVLIDAMAATDYLRLHAPDLFQTLCHVEATFVKQRPGADMVSFKPHIVTSSYNEEVVEINWSPPFEGPPIIDGTSTLKDMEDYIRAYQAMECVLNNHLSTTPSLLIAPELQEQLQAYARDYTWEYVLDPGDMLVFNNQRMCHGRRAFELMGSQQKRHLIGCYTDAMETINTYRLLLRSKGHQYGMRNVGNGTRGTGRHSSLE